MKLQHFVAGLLCAVLAAAAGRPAAGDDKGGDKPFDDATFVKKAAIGGMFEVESSKLAETKSTNDLVKKFADRMVKDHTKANEELMTIAKGMQAVVPEKMDAKHQKMVDQLSAASGADFDAAYIAEQVKAHDKTVALFKQASTEARNAQLKEFASKTLPTLEEHHKMAKDLQDQIKK